MNNAKVLIFVESRYQVNRKLIKSAVNAVLDEHNVKSSLEVSIAIVGDRKMKKLNKEFRNKEGTANILSFPLSEGEQSALPPSDVVRLGDIVISYPQVIKEAAEQELLVDERVD